ncbi:hypothetical protein F4055_19335 [Candidatus Poribacteria bacterium]|nr:hypothetical protein [Candidatus Poribacteria bacterium]
MKKLASVKETLKLFPDTTDEVKSTVFSTERAVQAPPIDLPDFLKPNTRLKMDGRKLLSHLPKESVPVAFLDPQYRGVLDRMNYGNEGKSREKRRCSLMQMPEELIGEFIRGIDSVLIPSGHLFLWMDKFHLCQGFKTWFDNTQLDIVYIIVWNKERF